MKTVHTEEQYRAIFEEARSLSFPAIDTLEIDLGFAIQKKWLDETALVLNCPVKVNPPNWQHGRVIYAVLREFLKSTQALDKQPMVMLDIGTAKAFSACVIAKALKDHGEPWNRVPVHTVDVIKPNERVIRNTIAEVNGLKTLYEISKEFIPEEMAVIAHGDGSANLLTDLKSQDVRIPFAFVDGKHARSTVYMEGAMIASMQKADDVVIFDDCQITEVRQAVLDLTKYYQPWFLDIGPRTYAISRRKP